MYHHNMQVLGRATADVEVQTSKAKNKYAKFSIAVNIASKKGKSKEAKAEETTYYYEILIFGKPSEVAANLIKKGDLVYVHGRPDYEPYITKATKGKEEEAKVRVNVFATDWQVVK